jgi:pSer/pThr/pTyr-binding forkhead associated (FHA) protein
VTQTDDDQTSPEIIAKGAVPDVEWTASAMLVVKRGPNAGSRFPLHQAVTSAGRNPRSDIFLDDVTVSRHHAEFRATAVNCRSSTLAASTASTSTASRSIRLC